MGMATGPYYGTTTGIDYYEDTSFYFTTDVGYYSVIPDVIIKDLSWYRKFDPVIKKDKPIKFKSKLLVKVKPLRFCVRNI